MWRGGASASNTCARVLIFASKSPPQRRCGQSPLGAIQSATIHAAELIRWEDRVGRIAPGYLADVIAVNGNPLQDVRLLENAVFVMKDGAVQDRGPDPERAQV